MKNKIQKLLSKLLCFLLLGSITISIFSVNVSAKGTQYTTDGLEKVIDGILIYKQDQSKVSSVQKLIDNEFAKKAGTSSTEWYIIALSQYKEDYDYSKYVSALDSYVKNMKSSNATDLQRIALGYSAAGCNTKFINKAIKDSIGKLGIMSYIYGLILIDSRAYTIETDTREEIVNKILSLRLKDGGWALSGKTSDIDITAMALQALAPYYKEKDVAEAVDGALKLLSKLQLKTGDFKSWGVRSCESTAQVINALCALGIDCQKDKRFIKNKKTLLDALMLFVMPDGSFCHSTDKVSNDTASVQAMTSLIAVWRQRKGFDSLYTFTDNAAEKSSLTDKNSITNQTVGVDQDKTSVKNNSSVENSTTGKSSNSAEKSMMDKNFPINIRVALLIIIVAVILVVVGFIFHTKKRKVRSL